MINMIMAFLCLRLWRKSDLKVYKLRKFIRNFKLWFDIIKNDEQWDYVFLEKVILHKLKLMRDFYDSGQNYTVADDTVKELNITINALERLLNNDYIKIPKGKNPKMVFEEVDSDKNHPVSIVKFIYADDFDSDAVDKAHKKAREDEMKDRELVYKMLRDKSPSWWD